MCLIIRIPYVFNICDFVFFSRDDGTHVFKKTKFSPFRINRRVIKSFPQSLFFCYKLQTTLLWEGQGGEWSGGGRIQGRLGEGWRRKARGRRGEKDLTLLRPRTWVGHFMHEFPSWLLIIHGDRLPSVHMWRQEAGRYRFTDQGFSWYLLMGRAGVQKPWSTCVFSVTTVVAGRQLRCRTDVQVDHKGKLLLSLYSTPSFLWHPLLYPATYLPPDPMFPILLDSPQVSHLPPFGAPTSRPP